MWTAIETLIQNGRGNRHLDLLNAIGVLHQRCSDAVGTILDADFDEISAQFAAELDTETAAALSAKADAFEARFPHFAAGLRENASRLAHRATETPQSNTPQTAEFRDRRVTTRDPADDMNNPITLARRASQQELLQIAALPNLPEALSNVLISRGDRDVLARVLNNRSSVIAKSSLTTLAELAPSDRLIKDALANRFDMPEPIVERVLPFLPIAQKASLLLCGGPFNSAYCSKAMQDADDDVQSALAAGQTMLTVPACIQALEQGTSSTSEIAILLAKETRIAELAAIVAYRLDISLPTAFNALSGRLDHATVVVLRALDCDMAAIDEVMQMRRRLGCREAKETRSAQMLSQRYSISAAQDLAKAFETALAQKSAVNTMPDALPDALAA